jgi:DNA-binding NarL/FixJ family response regulator
LGVIGLAVFVGAINVPRLVVAGLTVALHPAGYLMEEITEQQVPNWAICHERAVIVVSAATERDLGVIRGLTGNTVGSVIPVVALVQSATLEILRDCLHAGAVSCACIDWDTGDVVHVLEAAARRLVCVPVELLESLIEMALRKSDSVTDVCSDERSWLQALASGITTVKLATSIGYSEREMYRKLNALYKKMGVSNRAEALVLAARSGLIGDN